MDALLKELLAKADTAYKAKNYNLAIQTLLPLVEQKKANAGVFCNLGHLFTLIRQVQNAVNCYQEALKIEPHFMQTYHSFFKLLRRLGKNEDAYKILQMGLKQNPKDYLLYFELGGFYEATGNLDQAIAAYNRCVEIDPNFVKAINAMAGILYKQQQYEKAVQMFQVALDVEPNYFEVYSNMGAALNKLKRYDEATQALNKAIQHLPNSAGAYTNLGNVYNKQHNYAHAKKMHKKAIELDSKSALPYANLAIAQKNMTQMQEAIENFKKAITIDPKFVNAHFDLSTALLSIGEFQEGFREYEWRFYKEEMRGFIATHKDIFSKPMLTKNTNAYKKTVLVHSEQGFGDSIMMSRFLPMLKEKFGCEVVFKARDELVKLFQESFDDPIVARSEQTPEFDFHLPIMSAAYLLEVGSKEQFGKEPYLKAQKGVFELDCQKKNIGICWSASKTGESYEGKVFDLEYFRPLIESGKFNIYSLEVGEAKADIARCGFEDAIVDLSDDLSDFAKTASLVSELDLVITSDTSVAHLCGALGVKAWVVLQKVPDWRWGLEEDESYMYNSLTLLRQEKSRDWQSVFAKVHERLEL